ncbi:Ketosteroid isomerase-related protein [Comamonas aquatilis]|uniref:nuclear transport factor 2 family protein n=1 Tax=Comamonas aquatilis TaxID=1778406 RepID=UPI0039F0AAC2
MSTKESQPDAQFLARFSDAWNRHDIEALMGFMADECEFHAIAGPDLMGRSFVGRDAVRDGFQLAWQAFPDAAWVDGEHFVQGERGVSESTFKGTKADGLRVEARMVDVFTFRDGKIAVKNAYRKDRPPVALASA